jgi:hypothetical protein
MPFTLAFFILFNKSILFNSRFISTDTIFRSLSLSGIKNNLVFLRL